MQRLFFFVVCLCWAAQGSAQELLLEGDGADVEVATEEALQRTARNGSPVEGAFASYEWSPYGLTSQDTFAYTEISQDSTIAVTLEATPGSTSAEKVDEEAKDAGLPSGKHPVRGAKSLIVGSVFLVFLVYLLLRKVTSDDPATYPLDAKILYNVEKAGVFLEKRLGIEKLGELTVSLFLGAGPALVLSGLVGLISSFKQKKGKTNTLQLRGIIMLMVAFLALTSVSLTPRSGKEEEDAPLNVAIGVSIGGGLLGLLTLLTALGPGMLRSFKINRRLRTRPAESLANLQDASYVPDEARDAK